MEYPIRHVGREGGGGGISTRDSVPAIGDSTPTQRGEKMQNGSDTGSSSGAKRQLGLVGSSHGFMEDQSGGRRFAKEAEAEVGMGWRVHADAT